MEEHENLATSAPALEEALTLLGAAGHSDSELVCVLAALSTASFFFDHRLARYNERSIAALEQVLGLTLARRLRGVVGATLGLLFAVSWCAARLAVKRKDQRMPNFSQAMMLLFHAVGSIAGLCASCLDEKGVARCERALSPLAGLGRDTGAGIMHEFICSLVLTCRDGCAETSAHLTRLLARLDDPKPIRNLTDYQRRNMLGGVLISMGATQANQDGPGALITAERLAGLGLKVFEMNSAQIRSVWYAHQGKPGLAAKQTELAELCAIRLGTSWQVETWGAVATTGVTLRTGDTLATKRAVEQLRWLSRDLPSLKVFVQRGQAVHLLLHKKYQEAVQLLEENREPESLTPIGWLVARGMLARGYNGLGQHEHARDICQQALALMAPGDLLFTGLNLGPQIELAHAEAGLGRHDLAAQRLEALIASHLPMEGPLTLGLLHEARAIVAYGAAKAKAAAGEPARAELATYRTHVSEMELWLGSAGIPSLTERCERMHRAWVAVDSGNGTHTLGSLDTGDPSRTLDSLLGDGSVPSDQLVERTLQLLAETSGASDAHLFAWRDGAVHHTGSFGSQGPLPDVTNWAQMRLSVAHELLRSDTVVEEIGAGELERLRDTRVFDLRTHHIAILYGSAQEGSDVVGAIVLGAEGALEVPEARLFEIVGQRLFPAETLEA